MKCKKCGSAIEAGERFCPECGEAVKQGKKPAGIIIICVMIAAVLAALVCIIMAVFRQPESEKLRKIIESQTEKEIIEFCYEDFNRDEEYEAFAVIGNGNEKEFHDGELWFAAGSEAEQIEVIDEGAVNGIIDEDNQKFLSIERLENNKKKSFIYGVNDSDTPYEPEISGKYTDVHSVNGKTVAIDENGNTVYIDSIIRNTVKPADVSTEKTEETSTEKSEKKKEQKKEKTTEKTTQKKKEEGWQTAYKKQLNDIYNNQIKGDSAYNDARFKLAYIDEDDIPELIVSLNFMHICPADLYTYYNGEAVSVGSFGSFGVIYFRERTNAFLGSYYSSGYGGDAVYMLKNGKAEEIWNGGIGTVNDVYGTYRYFINENGEERDVSESEYKNERQRFLPDGVDPFANLDDSQRGVKFTPENIEKYVK